MIFVYDTIRYDTIRYDTIRYDTIRYDTGRVTPEQGILLGFPTLEQGDKFRMLVAHTHQIKAPLQSINVLLARVYYHIKATPFKNLYPRKETLFTS